MVSNANTVIMVNRGMTIREKYRDSSPEEILYQTEWRQYYIDHYRLPYQTRNYTEISKELIELRNMIRERKYNEIEINSNNQK